MTNYFKNYPDTKFIFIEKNLTEYYIDTDEEHRVCLLIAGELIEFSGELADGGSVRTFKDGFLHSYYDNPSITYHSCDEYMMAWHHEGLRHRVNGPQYISNLYGMVRYSWALDGKYITYPNYLKKMSEEDQILLRLKYACN